MGEKRGLGVEEKREAEVAAEHAIFVHTVTQWNTVKHALTHSLCCVCVCVCVFGKGKELWGWEGWDEIRR